MITLNSATHDSDDGGRLAWRLTESKHWPSSLLPCASTCDV